MIVAPGLHEQFCTGFRLIESILSPSDRNIRFGLTPTAGWRTLQQGLPRMGDVASVLFVMGPGGVTRHFPEHLGAAFLRTVLGAAGIGSLQYLPKKNPSLSGFADFLLVHRPVLVGFTVYETNLSVTRAMISVVREVLPGSVILLGGPNATFSPEETLALLGADGCLRGAGEGVIVSIAERILGSDRARKRLLELLADIANLVLWTPDGALSTPSRSQSSFPSDHFRTLDDIPSPFQHGFVSTSDIGYLTARGCNQNCTYCSFAAISGRKVVFHSVERVLDDMEALQMIDSCVTRRNTAIQVFDDAFTLAPERARQICEGMIRRKIRLPLSCETRGDRVDPDLLQLMRRAGFVGIAFGLESGVPRVLRTIGKVRRPESTTDLTLEAERGYLDRFRNAVRSAREAGLDVSVSIMGGLPGETIEDFKTTMAYVDSLGLRIYAHNTLNIFPGTPLYDQRHTFGLKAARDPVTRLWRTQHTYEVAKVPSLSNSTVRRWKWDEAERVSDALCGRPQPAEADGSAVWAVVLHRHPPSPELGRWLRKVLSIDGTVIAFAESRGQDAGDWCSLLSDYYVPCRGAIWFFPLDQEHEGEFEVFGTIGAHRVRFLSSCSIESSEAHIETDELGNCRFSVFIASHSDAEIKGATCHRFPSDPGLQIADSCRWWGRSPRCQRPNVLHVDADGRIRPCWRGPCLGKVGESLETILNRSAVLASDAATAIDGLHLEHACPLSADGIAHACLSIERLDIATQIGWRVPSSRFSNETVATSKPNERTNKEREGVKQ